MIGIKVNHYHHVFALSKKEVSDLHQMVDDFGDSNTDTSRWRPDISITRAQLGAIGNSNKQFLYDFPDGKDTGEIVQTFLRSPALDITEVDSATERITQIIERKSEIDKKSQAKLDKRQKDLKDLSDAIRNGSEPSEPSPGPSNS